jgi:hypothetical protein
MESRNTGILRFQLRWSSETCPGLDECILFQEVCCSGRLQKSFSRQIFLGSGWSTVTVSKGGFVLSRHRRISGMVWLKTKFIAKYKEFQLQKTFINTVFRDQCFSAYLRLQWIDEVYRRVIIHFIETRETTVILICMTDAAIKSRTSIYFISAE